MVVDGNGTPASGPKDMVGGGWGVREPGVAGGIVGGLTGSQARFA